MTENETPLAADERFFNALISGDIPSLEALLSDDFVIVDVMSGTPTPKGTLIDGIRVGVLTFAAVERDANEAHVRIYGDTGIIINQTVLRGALFDKPFQTRSRYTHVFVRKEGVWHMVSAQGTPIVAH
ncbi:MAG: nuclear transport factor 2 family protein [Candidatus Eremiobacteraeota bacterium]|nr:nuclear transport factor 2 family protein [Candidatus Eremiobacteraeota bacterium]